MLPPRPPLPPLVMCSSLDGAPLLHSQLPKLLATTVADFTKKARSSSYLTARPHFARCQPRQIRDKDEYERMRSPSSTEGRTVRCAIHGNLAE